ncbi:MAG: DinB family protein [Bacteroidota bacterium]
MTRKDLSLDEHGPYYTYFIGLVPEDLDLVPALLHSQQVVMDLFTSIPPDQLLHRYAPGKWSIKEVLLHLTDTERIFSYRTLRFARQDQTELAGFEQDDYIQYSDADGRSIESLLAERHAVRSANVALMRSLSEEALLRKGIASNNQVSVRGIGYITAGHDLHHCKIIRERYL